MILRIYNARLRSKGFMVQTRKKHYGDPVQKKPISFGKHYTKKMKSEDYNNNAHEEINYDESTKDLAAVEQKHRHILEEAALRNNTIINVVGVICWLIFCLSLLYVAVTQLEKDIIVALAVPLGGFLMICWLAYLKKIDFSRSNSKQGYHHSKGFRKTYRHR